MNQRDMNVAEAPIVAERDEAAQARTAKHVGRPMQRLALRQAIFAPYASSSVVCT